MAATTGPVLALGGIALGNRMILNDHPFSWEIPIATAITAGAFALLEKAWPAGARALAWAALVTVIVGRVDPGVPSPVESLNRYWMTRDRSEARFN